MGKKTALFQLCKRQIKQHLFYVQSWMNTLTNAQSMKKRRKETKNWEGNQQEWREGDMKEIKGRGLEMKEN